MFSESHLKICDMRHTDTARGRAWFLFIFKVFGWNDVCLSYVGNLFGGLQGCSVPAMLT
ncbi:hypothetical protein P175DRAFT_036009 [Aspergillus ochraceoroseus IBT 24754]|uniref:Uncharacterized protein n=1 Tax=Aspergillus ochraceoroseus IBT 24754 TaxID=1392256 RepID=A0A2T5M7E7_9EURO|nr:uncharacterized protein P175DRAFT_036009 [Aspergillus ochraceoroseus IBT 24754]PTU24444.1 hypothetical protein P175DRAFT_036009 [Aspergillus ochraceoroseus IBT 24754]